MPDDPTEGSRQVLGLFHRLFLLAGLLPHQETLLLVNWAGPVLLSAV